MADCPTTTFINTDLIPEISTLSGVISPPTSDDESIQNNVPTFTEICNSFFDKGLIRVISSLEECPRGAKPAIFFPNVRNTLTALHMKEFLESNQKQIKPREVRIFKHGDQSYVLAKFDKKTDCEKIYQWHKKGSSEIKYCYDGTDVPDSNWYCVVIRNIPVNAMRNFIEEKCSEFRDNINQELGMMKISGIICFAVVMKSLESAQQMCLSLNGKGNMKAHLHWKTCKKGNGKNSFLYTGKIGGGKKKKKEFDVIANLLRNEKAAKKMKK